MGSLFQMDFCDMHVSQQSVWYLGPKHIRWFLPSAYQWLVKSTQLWCDILCWMNYHIYHNWMREHNTLQWRHNGRDGVSDHQPHECHTQPFIQVQIKENIKAQRLWPSCREFPGDRWIEFPTQRASNADNVSIWWRHHEMAMKGSNSRTITNTNVKKWSLRLRHHDYNISQKIHFYDSCVKICN